MQRAVFGLLKKGYKPNAVELEALYVLLTPIRKALKLKNISKADIDERLLQAFDALYNFHMLFSSRPEHFWAGSPAGLPEFKKLRDLKAEARRVWKELYPAKSKAK